MHSILYPFYIGLPSPAALSDTHRHMIWNATKLVQDSPPISPLVSGFPAPSMNPSIYQFPHVATSSSTNQDGTLKSPLMPLSGVNPRAHFQPHGLSSSGYHVSGSPVGYGPSTFSSAQVHIQGPNSVLKAQISPNEQGSAFVVPKMEHSRSANNSPHLSMD